MAGGGVVVVGLAEQIELVQKKAFHLTVSQSEIYVLHK